MEARLKLSADAILYAAATAGADSVYGVMDTLADLTVADYPVFTKRAVDELLKVGCMEMDFDGNQDMTADFKKIISTIAYPKFIVDLSVRKIDGSDVLRIVYETDGFLVLSEHMANIPAEYCISGISDSSGISDIVLKEIELPSSTTDLRECIVSTEVLLKKDKQAIFDTVEDKSSAEMIYGSVMRQNTTLRVRLIGDKAEKDFRFYIIGHKGILDAKVEYTENDELMRYTPVTVDELKKSIACILKGQVMR